MLTSHPPAALKPMRPRTGLRAAVCAFGLAAVLVAAVGPPAHEREAEAASHTPRSPGEIWVATTAGAATWQWTHTNLWVCNRAVCNDSAGIGQGSARRGATASTTCAPLPRAATESAAYAAGCNGHKPGNSGWRFTGHDTANTGSKVAGSALYACTVTPNQEPVSDPADCGDWAACSSTTVPNAARTGCVPCPSGQEPDPGDRDSCRAACSPSSQHRHGSGECEDNHRYGAAGPDCPTPITETVVLNWTYHTAAKENATGTKTCTPPELPIPDCEDGQHRHGATGACGPDHPYGWGGPVCATDLTEDTTVEWVYHNAAGADTDGEKICPKPDIPLGGGGGQTTVSPQGSAPCNAVQRRVYPFGKSHTWGSQLSKVASITVGGRTVHTPTPAQRDPGKATFRETADLWIPRVGPRGGADAAPAGGGRQEFTVTQWLGGHYTGADRPAGWQSDTTGGPHGGGIIQAPTVTSGGGLVSCGSVRIRHSGAGWRLVNLALADPEAATSGTGRGERTFTVTGLIDDAEPAGYAGYDEWQIIAELDPRVGEPWPFCTRAETATTRHPEGTTQQQPAETLSRGRGLAYLGLQAGWQNADGDYPRFPGWRPAGGYISSTRACGWTVRIWSAVVVRLDPCGGAIASRDSEGNVLYCVYPGI